ncbi:hypothetical protein C8N40_103101 [Pontibacter mucosus]|uniref:Uncharacterized protein n=1 Tax=Pontibacter mucosus TaxID=1649266 RepID=A0A2T5YL21_9BACT|nr:hypothetical protein [Pontibacter mucosus]PTX20029.1 hypothetical protein C8N40_103101 [Pontibacter mucosus]
MEERRNNMPEKAGKKKPILNEDEGKRTPPGPTGYITGGKTQATRPEQGPDVPPQDRTTGIP